MYQPSFTIRLSFSGSSEFTLELEFILINILLISFSCSYFTSIFGAWLADSFLGKFRTIFYISIIYAIGKNSLYAFDCVIVLFISKIETYQVKSLCQLEPFQILKKAYLEIHKCNYTENS